MTDLRKAAEMALDSILDIPMDRRSFAQMEAVTALRQALAQPYEVLAEREACAEVCDEVANKHARVHYPQLEGVADECAGKIRERGEK